MRPFWKPTVLCLAASLYAQEAISLSGQVVDRQGRALPSIEVLLVGQNLADTTDTEGRYAIERSAALPEDPQASTVRPTGLFPAPQSVHRLFNAHGRAQNTPRPYALPHQAYFVQSAPTAPQSTENALRLASAGQDQLQFSQNGNLLAVQPVMALSAVMGVTTVNPVTTFVDERDGREYRYIESAGQYWMAQNLNYGYKVAASNTMASDNFTEKYCVGDDTLNCNLWGGLYKWAEAMALPSSCNKYDCASKITPTGHQGICPDGWTIPTPADWSALVASGNGDAATMAPLLKNDTGWAQSLNGTNDLSFNALPTGSRNSKAQFVNQGTHAYWWSATQYDVENATVQYIWGSKDGLYESTSLKGDNGFGVRCKRLSLPQPNGQLTWEKWNGNYAITSFPFSTNPNSSGQVNSFEAPMNTGSNYAFRIYGYIYPPITGYYIFWIAADDSGELYMSNSNVLTTLSKEAYTTQYTNYRQWDKNISQKSRAIFLNRFNKYAIEARLIESVGSDHLSIGWSKPGENTAYPQEVIGVQYISSE